MIFKNYFSYKKENLMTVIIFLLIWYVISYLINLIPDNFSKLIFFVFILNLILMLLILFVRKFGVVLIFYLIGSLFSIKMPNLEGFQLDIVPSLIIISLVFELLFFISYFIIKNRFYSKIFSLSIANATLIISLGFFVSYGFLIMNLNNLINLFFIFFSVNLVGCTLGVFIWHSFRNSKFILKLEYSNE
ncbi:MAG: hypothetical protein KJ674_05200 [Nanoarchaeota archaeon]|nr:hypothetical protein [Nanoarchaeota archaeon]